MTVIVWASALAVTVSIPMLLWALRSGPELSTSAVRRNLGAPAPDLRRERLRRPLTERALMPALERIARVAGSVLPAQRIDASDRLLALSGMTGRLTGEQLFGAKLLVAAVTGVALTLRAASDPSLQSVGVTALGIAAGFLAPDQVLKRRAKERQKQMEQDLPDILDQLTISIEAGLGFEAALQRVVRNTPGPLSDEFGRMLQDVRVGTRRADALEAVVERTDAPDLRHVVISLIQAERLGVPLAKTLRTQSQEMRQKRRMKAEESANKVAVKLLFPVVFCLFPALFIVILGPAAIRISQSSF